MRRMDTGPFVTTGKGAKFTPETRGFLEEPQPAAT